MESSLADLARLSLTLAALVLGGRLGRCLDAPLVGEIVAGMLLGPDGVGLVPEPSAWVMVGNLGLTLLVMEGGLHIDVTSLRRVGPVAVVIAVAGTVLPIALGTGYMVAAGYDPETGVAAGTSLSSTSIGMATAMMSRVGELNTPLGSLICVAAMVDDILSLVILAVVGTLGTGADSADSGAASAVAARARVRVGQPRRRPPRPVGVCHRPDPHRRRQTPNRTRTPTRALVLVTMLVLTPGLTLASGAAGSTFSRRFRRRLRVCQKSREREGRVALARRPRRVALLRLFPRGRHANPAHARVQRARVRARRGVRRPRGGG